MKTLFCATIATTALLASATTTTRADPTPAPISPRACLRKMAMDLTNKAPSEEDFSALASGKSLSEFADQYIAGEAFSKIMFDVFRGAFPPTDLVPADADKEEPARILRHLIDTNGDFRDMVIGNYTVDTAGKTVPANGVASGILTTRSYLSAYSGSRFRNWSGHVLRGLAGIALTPISGVPPGIDDSRSGIAAAPACAGCHANPLSGVDNVASFHDCFDAKGLPVAGCTPSGSTSFLGKAGSTIADLGRILAESVEWRARAVQTFHRIFWGRDIARNETSFYFRAEKAWLDVGYKPRELVKHIVLSPEYCTR